jgi:CRISPR-associated protein Cas2
MTKHFIVVAYDIPNDKRRTRLRKALENFGTPVQYSVFECLLTPPERAKMEKAVARLIKPTLDSVRYYPLCAECRAKITTTAAGREVTHEVSVIIV